MECRFCLQPQEADKDPLISPCHCKGSAKYVHINCLKTWRQTTVNPEAVERCQLCREEFNLILRWPIEHIPDIGYISTWFLLSKPLLISLFIYSVSTMLYIKSDYRTNILTFLLYDSKACEFYYYIMLSYTITYCLYYIPFFVQVKSKLLYLNYWMTYYNSDLNPRYTIVYTLVSLALSYSYMYPFGFIYIFSLPKLFITHIRLLEQMNKDASLY